MHRSMKSTTRSAVETAMLSIACLTLLCAMPACRTIRVVPADKALVRLEANRPYSPTIPGWFVPDARMLEILEKGLTTK